MWSSSRAMNSPPSTLLYPCTKTSSISGVDDDDPNPPPDPDPNPPPDPPRRSGRTRHTPKDADDARFRKAVQEAEESSARQKTVRNERRALLKAMREDVPAPDPNAEINAQQELIDMMADLNLGEEESANLHEVYNTISDDIHTLQYADEPRTWDEAKASPDAAEWEKGYREELDGLKAMGPSNEAAKDYFFALCSLDEQRERVQCLWMTTTGFKRLDEPPHRLVLASNEAWVDFFGAGGRRGRIQPQRLSSPASHPAYPRAQRLIAPNVSS
ncbi:hypothetical protein BDZ89DRAFT_1040564 [Hymenopellis radicata]|nr:hypothetical protein BDZ89DRAFT_1040564 [Hymenopellis radicata]